MCRTSRSVAINGTAGSFPAAGFQHKNGIGGSIGRPGHTVLVMGESVAETDRYAPIPLPPTGHSEWPVSQAGLEWP